MSGPNADLLKQYGTKVASSPFAAKVLFAMSAMAIARNFAKEQHDQRLQAEMMNDRFQQLQMAELASTRQGAQYTRPPMMIAPEGVRGDENAFSGVPLGFDQGMVRMAAVAAKAGRELAMLEKQALGLPGIGMAGGAMGRAAGALGEAAKAPLRKAVRGGALAVGALGLGAYAASKPVMGALARETKTPTYGATAQGAPQLAYGVNEYGSPEMGSPFVR